MEVTWEDLCALLSAPRVYPEKQAAPGWSPAAFARDVRAKRGVECVSALVFDVDNHTPLVDVRAAVGAYRAIVHSTYSATEECQRWRVVLALAESVSAVEFDRLYRSVAASLPLVTDPVTRDNSRLWFLPSIPREGAWFVSDSWDGMLIGRGNIERRIAERVKDAGEGKRNSTLNAEVYHEVKRNGTKLSREKLIALVEPLGLTAGEIGATTASAERAAAAERATKLADLPAVCGVDGEWTNGLVYSKGGIKSCASNVVHVLKNHPEWRHVLSFNELRSTVQFSSSPPCWVSDRDVFPRDIVDHDLTSIVDWLERSICLTSGPSMVAESVRLAADANRVNPLVSLLRQYRWDGIERLYRWMHTYLGAADNDYTRAVGSKYLISAVARAFVPGCKVDTVPILEGAQGTGKSTAVSILALSDEWFFDSDLKIGDKDAIQATRGKWQIELQELSSLDRAEVRVIKAFVSRRIDTFRPSFGRFSVDVPRRFVIIGTTNPDGCGYLNDVENRRFLPVLTGEIKLDMLRRDVGQLYAEAVALFDSGAPWHIDSEEINRLCAREQRERRRDDPWEGLIADYIAKDAGIGDRGVTIDELLSSASAVGKPKEHWTSYDSIRVGKCLATLGYHASREGNRRVYRK